MAGVFGAAVDDNAWNMTYEVQEQAHICASDPGPACERRYIPWYGPA